MTIPSFFFGPAQNQKITIEALRTLILDMLAALGRPEAEQGIVPPFFDSLPSKVQPFQIGLMFSRSGMELRMVVDGLPPRGCGRLVGAAKMGGGASNGCRSDGRAYARGAIHGPGSG